ncbi:MAG: nif-specific transcriptional activator NifA [Proteobacteria bacterium]|nr:nif-specific transcriptional activator NifA [Pseudomonadota bacterium]MBU1611100.1 nif-specific transcriptional activator NifA [Pseudomonadota bacterium]
MHSSIRNLKFAALIAICQIIDKALDIESALVEVLRILSENLAMKRATVTLYDPRSGHLSISASYGLSREEKSRGVYAMDEGVTGRIFQTAEPFYVPDITKEPLFLDKTGSRSVERGRVSFIGVPIMLHGAPIGVLNVDRLFGDEVSFEEDVDFLSVVATLMAQFISLSEKVKEREEELRRENVSLKYQISKHRSGPYIVGRSLAMQDVERQMERVAPTRATVLLLGESGVGKTLIAKIIHELSDRKSFPFVKVNCAAIPENLLESELFGYEKGAFTGASGTKPGRFEEADKGTIFLDEIGELSLSIQAKLLRVLQEREFERLGSNRTRQVNVRIVTATNKDLEHMAEVGQFRSDLYYRLSVFPIRVPSVRERKEDIPGLLSHFLNKMANEYGRQLYFSPESMDALGRYNWPGNVREMENLIERLVIMAEDDRVEEKHIRIHLSREGLQEACVPKMAAPSQATLEHSYSLAEVEQNELVAALARHGWVQYKAAQDLELTPRQMGYRVRKFGLEGRIAEGRAASRRNRGGK